MYIYIYTYPHTYIYTYINIKAPDRCSSAICIDKLTRISGEGNSTSSRNFCATEINASLGQGWKKSIAVMMMMFTYINYNERVSQNLHTEQPKKVQVINDNKEQRIHKR
jgi:hypothetical protein